MEHTTVQVELAPPSDAIAEDLSRAAIEFRREVLTLPVEAVDFARDSEAPEGAKAADALSLGQLLIVTIPTSGVLSAITAIAVAKIRAGAVRSARLTVDNQTLELTGQPDEVQQRLVEQWLEKIAGRPADE